MKLASALTMLKSLKDAGAIDEEEFEQQKNRLLDECVGRIAAFHDRRSPASAPRNRRRPKFFKAPFSRSTSCQKHPVSYRRSLRNRTLLRSTLASGVRRNLLLKQFRRCRRTRAQTVEQPACG